MKFSIIPTFVSALLVAASAVCAAPVASNELLVFSPHITSPTAGQQYPVGSTQTVTWDTSDIPPEKQDSKGLLLLGREYNGSENLNITNPLASGFPLNTGSVEITVPNVPAYDDYIVVLFGDSGNASPQFSITNSTASSS